MKSQPAAIESQRLPHAALVVAWRASQRCTRVSSQTLTLNRIHGPVAWRACQGATQPQRDTEGEIQCRSFKCASSRTCSAKEQKLISKLTDAMVSIEGESMRGVTWCVIEEVESGDWGIGSKALTTADVHALARSKAA
jgi:4-oxalocrotonate tautomerase